MLDEATIRRLIKEAADGSPAAWDALVDGFAGLVWSVIRGHGLYGAEASDVSQTVWLRFVEHLGRLREPERAGAWLATTARHECLRVLRKAGRNVVMADVPEVVDARPESDPGRLAVAAEEHTELMAALEQVSPQCQALLRLLIADPPLSYDDISLILEMPKGSIGPTRMRCLERMRSVMESAGSGRITDRATGSGQGKEVTP